MSKQDKAFKVFATTGTVIGFLIGVAMMFGPQITLFRHNCSPDYSPCVPVRSYDIDCSDLGYSVTVKGNDVYRLDSDDDGSGCESYRFNWFWPVAGLTFVGWWIGGWVALPVVIYFDHKDDKQRRASSEPKE